MNSVITMLLWMPVMMDINTATMQSRLVKGLYFAGEIIDVDGGCGGFNLQWAWASGLLAGESVFGR